MAGRYQLSFSALHDYAGIGTQHIVVPIRLTNGDKSTDLEAKLDTGAACCIFNREYAEVLEIDLESGQYQAISTVMGQFSTYGHEVMLTVLEFEFDTTVYFAEDESYRRNVLGLNGFVEQFRLGLIHHDSELYLGSYDD